jgi:glycosyltransferase involved in cell wall biosynthesis
MVRKKRRVVFVGAFNANASTMGGQLFACRSLIASPLSQSFEWKLIDTTAPTNLKRGLLSRTFPAVKRIVSFLFNVLRGSDTCLIFFADRASFIEKGLMAISAKLLGKKVVLCPRSGLLIDDIKRSAFWQIFSRVVFRASDIVVCQSITWKNFFRDNTRLSAEKFIVIPNWIDFTLYQENYFFQQKRKTTPRLKILFLGWVTREKGIFELIAAFERLASFDIELTIAGDGHDLATVRDNVQSSGLQERVIFAGWVQNETKADLLKNSDIFVLPSHYEGLPNSVLEAMLSGIPVITTKVGGLPDLINDGVSGYLVESGNISQLADRMENLINSGEKRSLFSKRAFEYVSQNHSVNNAVKIFENIL